MVFCRFQSHEFQCTKHHRHKPDTKQHEKHHKIRSKPNMKPQTQRETRTASRSFITLGCTNSPTMSTDTKHTRHETSPSLGAIFSCNSCRDCEPEMSLPRAATMLFHTLKTVTSLNKESRPFFLSDKSIWSFPSVSSLSDYSISRS